MSSEPSALFHVHVYDPADPGAPAERAEVALAVQVVFAQIL
jgi:alkylhydroperoxidase family enzyme